MMPSTPVLRRADFVVESLPMAMGREMVAAHHYLGGSSKTAVFRHGLFAADNAMVCCGTALWIPAAPASALSVSADPNGVLALTRLVVDPDMPKNTASYLLGRSMRLVKSDGRFHTLVTYADEGQSHTGAIYRATNWEYVGLVEGKARFVDSLGRGVATKAGKNRTYAEMLDLGYRKLPPTRKHKFVKHLRVAQATPEIGGIA